MPREYYLDDIVAAQKRGETKGIPSICSAHPFVLLAAMRRAARTGTQVLVESTCNQVNQFGGYTYMTPADFVTYVSGIAQQNGLPAKLVILGGDHLGPAPWKDEPAASAMQKAKEMVSHYVRAGYVKIHLDASMKLDDDDASRSLDVELAAQRAAALSQVAEATWKEQGSGLAPRYVIGTEVPIPGGAQKHEEGVAVTSPESTRQTIEITRQAFLNDGLADAWERVMAVVVQPSVEFGDDFVLDYRPEAARALSGLIESEPRLVYEAHSTDYQTRDALRHLVRDHFAILKVGPGMTFAFREAVFALALMENELLSGAKAAARSNLIEILDEVMVHSPEHWRKYYTGDEEAQRFARKYSFSDRARYYWPDSKMQVALQKLWTNLNASPLPLSLLSQYAPMQYEHIRAGMIANTPEAIVLDRIDVVLGDYAYACGEE